MGLIHQQAVAGLRVKLTEGAKGKELRGCGNCRSSEIMQARKHLAECNYKLIHQTIKCIIEPKIL